MSATDPSGQPTGRAKGWANLRPWKKGQGGGGVWTKEQREALAILKAATPAAARKLVALLDDPNPMVSLKAAMAINERALPAMTADDAEKANAAVAAVGAKLDAALEAFSDAPDEADS